MINLIGGGGRLRKTHPLLKIVNGTLIDLPAPISISNFWNYGRLLGLFLGVQIISGLILASHYTSSRDKAFERVVHIIQDVNYG